MDDEQPGDWQEYERRKAGLANSSPVDYEAGCKAIADELEI